MTQIGRDWLANDPDPGTIMGLPVFRDLYDSFHLAWVLSPVTDSHVSCSSFHRRQAAM